MLAIAVAAVLVTGLILAQPGLRLHVDRGAFIRDTDLAARVVWLRAIDTTVQIRLRATRDGDWTLILENASPDGALVGAELRASSGNVLHLETSVARNQEQTIRYQAQFPEDEVEFVVVGKSGGGSDVLAELVEEINAREPFCVVHCGGLTERGAWAEFEAHLRIVSRLRCPVFHVAGADEATYRGRRRFRELVGPLHSTVSLGPVRLLLADSASGRLTDAEREWLGAALDESSGQRVVLSTYSLPIAASGAWTLRPSDVRWLTERILAGPVAPGLVCSGGITGMVEGSLAGIRVVAAGGAGDALLPGAGEHHAVMVRYRNGRFTVGPVPVGVEVFSPSGEEDL